MKRISVAVFCMLLLAVFFACADEADVVSDVFVSGNVSEVLDADSSSDVSNDASSYDNSFASSDADFSERSEETESSDIIVELPAESSEEELGSSEEMSEDISFEESDETSYETSDDNSKDEDKPTYNDIGDAEMLPSGYLLYNGAAYSAAGYSYANCERYANVYARYAELFPDTRINVINPPLSAINIANPLVRQMFNDQGVVLDRMETHIYGNVNFVNLKNTFEANRGRYFYFKSDFHWTQLGAYHAYSEFAKSIGLTPTPLSMFERDVVTNAFIGAVSVYGGDDRISSFYDTIYTYMPRKSHTMTIYYTNGEYNVYDNCIVKSIKTYSCFIVGDNPVTVINVPENDQFKSVLVIKESSANAFVPFLTEHYGKIYVIDPRHIEIDIRDMVAEKEIDDIIFFAMASTANGSTYCNYYENMIGE